jgi:hypothetical protein
VCQGEFLGSRDHCHRQMITVLVSKTLYRRCKLSHKPPLGAMRLFKRLLTEDAS